MSFLTLLQRRRSARILEQETRAGPPYLSQIDELRAVLQGELSERRIDRGHA